MRPSTAVISLLLGGSLAADNCTETSQSPGSPTYWKIDDFILKVYNWNSGGSMGTFSFNSYHSATNRTVKCMVQDVDLAKLWDEPWSTCDAPGTVFRFNLDEISLSVRETWTCEGVSGQVDLCPRFGFGLEASLTFRPYS